MTFANGFSPLDGIRHLAQIGAVAGVITVAHGAGSHHARIQAAIDLAESTGINRVYVPQLDPNEDSVPWVVDDKLVCFAGLYVDASSAIIATAVITQPAFYIAPHVNDVTIDVLRCDGPNPRAVWTDYGSGTVNGATARASQSGVMSYGARTTVKGRFENFRNGVRLGNWSGAGAIFDELRDSCAIDIVVKNVDFGLVYFGQNGLRANVRGSYTPTIPPHLIYATSALSTSCVVSGDAWHSDGGVPFMFKGQASLTAPRCRPVTAPACSTSSTLAVMLCLASSTEQTCRTKVSEGRLRPSVVATLLEVSPTAGWARKQSRLSVCRSTMQPQ
jgi:hypothetical protein